jgi:nucleotide-binding universal stress UspA family protein
MFEKVLVPTDFSKHARRVIECVGEIPGVREVVIISVLSRDPLARVWDPVAEVKEVEQKLMDEKQYVGVPDINFKVRAVSVMEGEVASAINRVAEEENVSLVAMGARGKSLIESVLLGSVSKNVLRYGKTHLLIMRYKTIEGTDSLGKYCERIFAKVLFPLDFSEPSEAALSFLKNTTGIGELVLLNVVSTGETKEQIDANVSDAEKKLAELAQELGKNGLKITHKVLVGHPVEVIRKAAKDEDVSLIAISSQGSAAIKKGRIGSTAYDVANSSDRPGLVLSREKISMY